jgi:hypothetical protein
MRVVVTGMTFRATDTIFGAGALLIVVAGFAVLRPLGAGPGPAAGHEQTCQEPAGHIPGGQEPAGREPGVQEPAEHELAGHESARSQPDRSQPATHRPTGRTERGEA